MSGIYILLPSPGSQFRYCDHPDIESILYIQIHDSSIGHFLLYIYHIVQEFISTQLQQPCIYRHTQVIYGLIISFHIFYSIIYLFLKTRNFQMFYFLMRNSNFIFFVVFWPVLQSTSRTYICLYDHLDDVILIKETDHEIHH